MLGLMVWSDLCGSSPLNIPCGSVPRTLSLGRPELSFAAQGNVGLWNLLEKHYCEQVLDGPDGELGVWVRR